MSLSYGSRVPFAALVVAFVVAGSACSSNDQPESEQQSDRTPMGEIRHLPTFAVPDGFAREESTEVGPLTLDDRTGCLTWDGYPAAFPQGTAIAGDGSILLPNGKTLRWWEKAEFFQTQTTGPANSGFEGLQECLPAGDGPFTVVWVTGVPSPDQQG